MKATLLYFIYKVLLNNTGFKLIGSHITVPVLKNPQLGNLNKVLSKFNKIIYF